MSTKPGWYRDPAGVADLRYFDGENWTEQTRNNSVTPQVQATDTPALAAGDTIDVGWVTPALADTPPELPTQPVADWNGWSVQSDTLESGVIDDDEVSGFSRTTNKGTHTFKLILLAGIGVLVAIGLVTAVVLLLGGSQESAPPTTPAIDPPASTYPATAPSTASPSVSSPPTPAPSVTPPTASTAPSEATVTAMPGPTDAPIITEADVTPEAGQKIVADIVTWVDANRTAEGNAPDNVAFGRAVLDGSVNPAYGWKNDYFPNGKDFCIQLTLFSDESLTVTFDSLATPTPTVGAVCARPN